MAEEAEQNGINAIVFVIEKDENERNRVSGIIGASGCAVVPLPSIDNATLLLRNNAACDLIILAIDAMDDCPESFDQLFAARQPAPAIVIYGVDPDAKIVIHCLRRGASDFIAKPVDDDDLVNAVLNAVYGDENAARSESHDAIQADMHVSGWVELTASSELEQFRRLQRFSDALFATHLPREVCDDLKMAIEEVGRNAVEWGNNFNPDKQVHISYCMFSDRVVIKVEDEGEGFTPGSLPDPTADPVRTMRERQSAGKRPGGYGVYLLHKLVDDIVYNEKGNTVLLIKYFPAPKR